MTRTEFPLRGTPFVKIEQGFINPELMETGARLEEANRLLNHEKANQSVELSDFNAGSKRPHGLSGCIRCRHSLR